MIQPCSMAPTRTITMTERSLVGMSDDRMGKWGIITNYVLKPVYDRNLFLFCFGMFFSVQQNFCFNRKFTPEIEQKQKECVDPVLFILLQICSYNCSGKLGQIGSFCCYFCSSKLRHLSVNRISVSVNFAETSYGRTLDLSSAYRKRRNSTSVLLSGRNLLGI